MTRLISRLKVNLCSTGSATSTISKLSVSSPVDTPLMSFNMKTHKLIMVLICKSLGFKICYSYRRYVLLWKVRKLHLISLLTTESSGNYLMKKIAHLHWCPTQWMTSSNSLNWIIASESNLTQWKSRREVISGLIFTRCVRSLKRSKKRVLCKKLSIVSFYHKF
jgi:hypothetical protein